jgi:hypothetical protein
MFLNNYEWINTQCNILEESSDVYSHHSQNFKRHNLYDLIIPFHSRKLRDFVWGAKTIVEPV